MKPGFLSCIFLIFIFISCFTLSFSSWLGGQGRTDQEWRKKGFRASFKSGWVPVISSPCVWWMIQLNVDSCTRNPLPHFNELFQHPVEWNSFGRAKRLYQDMFLVGVEGLIQNPSFRSHMQWLTPNLPHTDWCWVVYHSKHSTGEEGWVLVGLIWVKLMAERHNNPRLEDLWDLNFKEKPKILK